MSKLLISYINDWDAGTVTASTEHPAFSAINTQNRWFKKPWRSKYGTGSGWGLFRTVGFPGLHFKEGGGGVLTANITQGDYDSVSLCAEIKLQMEVAGALTYTPTYDEATNKITIAGSGAFTLSLSTGVGTNIFPILGWTAIIDTASLASHTAPEARINSEEYLYCNAGSAKTENVIVLKNHNLQATAVVTILYYSDAFVTIAATNSVPWHAETMAIRVSRNYQYFAVKIVDPTNPAGYLEVGRVWMGAEFLPHYGYNPEHSFSPQDPSVISSSDDGQDSSVQRSHYATWDYIFDAMTPADRIIFAAMFALVGKSLPVFIAEAPVTSDIGLLAKYITWADWEEFHVAGSYWGLNVSVKSER